MRSILFIVNNISKLGGVEKITISLSNELCGTFNVYILSICNYDKKPPLYDLDNRVNLIYLERGNKLFQLKKTKDIIKQYKINTIIIQTKNLYYFTYLKFVCKRHIIFVDHDSLKAYPYKQKNEYLPRKRAIKHSDLIILLTEENKREYMRQYKVNNKIIVIGNYVENPSGRINYDVKSKEIVAVGRYHTQKRFDLLIHAFSLIARKYPDWILKIYGEGELRNNLQQLIYDEKISSQIFLCGRYNSIDDAFANKSFCVMTSEHEGFPLTLLEALSYKLPTVCFDFPSGPSEIIINNVNGIIVPMGNIQLLSNAIELLITNPETRIDMSKHTNLSTGKYTKNIVIKKWKKILMAL